MQKKILIAGMIIILLLNAILVGTVNANSKIVTVYTEGRYPSLLKYNDVTVGCVGVSYYDGTMEYPAYCLERDIPGIGEVDFYDVELQDTLTNTLIWRVVSNSYPYRTLQELGVQNIEEAFVATKQAVYCIIYGNDANNFTRYSAIGEAGQRTLNLLKKLVTDARNSSSVKPSKIMSIRENSNEWQVDSIDKNYISKTYSVSSDVIFNTYEVNIDFSKLPIDSKVGNTNNGTQKVFNSGENFKVLIPINHKITNGDFDITVKAKLKTCPVYYGKAPSGKQNYALAAYAYEDGLGGLNQTFTKNNSKIIIIKKDGKTNEYLSGTEFNILDSNKKIKLSNLITNENGRVIVNGIEPGKYFLQEVRATNGYQKTDRLVEFNIELDKEITITVNNNKTVKSEINVNTGEINVNIENTENNVVIKNEEQNINNNNLQSNINISTSNLNENNSNINNDVNINSSNLNENNSTINNNINNNEEVANINNKLSSNKRISNIDNSVVNNNINENENTVNIQNTNKINTLAQNSDSALVKKLPKTGF